MLLYITLNPTITYQVVDQGGAVYTTAVTKLNFTTLGVTSYTVHVTLYNSVDNSGVVNCLDIVNNLRWDSWLVWSNTTYTSFNGHISVQRGTTIYGLGQIQGSSLIRQKIGNAYPQMGTVTFDITFNKGSLAHGSYETIPIKGYEYFDESSFALTGSGGSSATQLGSTFNLVLAC
jgi:hypothetical protein